MAPINLYGGPRRTMKTPKMSRATLLFISFLTMTNKVAKGQTISDTQVMSTLHLMTGSEIQQQPVNINTILSSAMAPVTSKSLEVLHRLSESLMDGSVEILTKQICKNKKTIFGANPNYTDCHKQAIEIVKSKSDAFVSVTSDVTRAVGTWMAGPEGEALKLTAKLAAEANQQHKLANLATNKLKKEQAIELKKIKNESNVETNKLKKQHLVNLQKYKNNAARSKEHLNKIQKQVNSARGKWVNAVGNFGRAVGSVPSAVANLAKGSVYAVYGGYFVVIVILFLIAVRWFGLVKTVRNLTARRTVNHIIAQIDNGDIQGALKTAQGEVSRLLKENEQLRKNLNNSNRRLQLLLPKRR